MHAARFPSDPISGGWITLVPLAAVRSGLGAWAVGPLLAVAALAWLMPRSAAAQAAEHAAPTGQRSLAPLEVEAFRQRYGQQQLFRLRLGADAGFETFSAGSACAGFQADWAVSAQHSEFERALSAGQPFAAGQALGRWQRLASQCR